jgi:hypothetical protein
MHLTQSALPAEIQLNSSTGLVTATHLLLPDTYYLLVTGTLPSRQRLSIQLVLNVIERPLSLSALAFGQSLLNTGPPSFASDFPGEVLLYTGESRELPLPQVIEPDNEGYDLTVLLETATTFSLANRRTILMRPDKPGEYWLEVVLTDRNERPK